MVDYNRDYNETEACKDPRKLTQEECEAGFENATW